MDGVCITWRFLDGKAEEQRPADEADKKEKEEGTATCKERMLFVFFKQMLFMRSPLFALMDIGIIVVNPFSRRFLPMFFLCEGMICFVCNFMFETAIFVLLQ